jgi:hypothetical protein
MDFRWIALFMRVSVNLQGRLSNLLKVAHIVIYYILLTQIEGGF